MAEEQEVTDLGVSQEQQESPNSNQQEVSQNAEQNETQQTQTSSDLSDSRPQFPSTEAIASEVMQKFGVGDDLTTAIEPNFENKQSLEEITNLFGEELGKAVSKLDAEGQRTVNNLIDEFAKACQNRDAQYAETENKLAEFTSTAIPVYQRRVDTINNMLPDGQGKPAFDNVDEYHDYLEQFDSEFARNPHGAIAHLLFSIQDPAKDPLDDPKTLTQVLFGKIFEEYKRIRTEVKTMQANPALMASVKQRAELERQAKYAQKQMTIEQESRETAVNALYDKAVKLFAEEKDAQGNLTHPYFAYVQKEMADLSEKLNTDDYQYLYDMACAVNAEVKKAVASQTVQTQAVNKQGNNRSPVYRPLGNSINAGKPVTGKKTSQTRRKNISKTEEAVDKVLEQFGLDESFQSIY